MTRKGIFGFKILPFGLCNVPSTFQLAFDRLREADLKLKPSKCSLFQEKVKFLGSIVSGAPNPEKDQTVAEWMHRQNLTEVCNFATLASYCRCHIPSFAEIIRPLHELMKENARFDRGPKRKLSRH